MDPHCEPLRTTWSCAGLSILRAAEHACRWRKWIIFDCNWKVAMESFARPYHVPGTHPESRNSATSALGPGPGQT